MSTPEQSVQKYRGQYLQPLSDAAHKGKKGHTKLQGNNLPSICFSYRPGLCKRKIGAYSDNGNR